MNRLLAIIALICLLVAFIALIHPRMLGIKNTPTSSRWKLPGLAIALMIGLLASIAYIADKPDNQAYTPPSSPPVKTIKISSKIIDDIYVVVMDELSLSLDRKPSIFTSKEAMKITGIDYKITSGKFNHEFKNNETESLKKFKGKTIAIKGIIKDFSTDLFGNPTITLSGSDHLSGVEAEFPKTQTEHTESLTMGQEVTFICKGSAKTIDAPLSDCQSLIAWKKTKNKRVRSYIADGLTGKSEIHDEIAAVAAMISLRGDQMQNDQECTPESADDDFMQRCIAPLFKAELTEEEKQQIADFGNTLIMKKTQPTLMEKGR